MRKFDYSFLEHGLLPAGLINLVGTINTLKERDRGRKETFSEIYVKLEQVAKVQSVKGSNEIEGIVTTDKRINEIVIQNSVPENHNEAEIAGYRDALNLIHTGFDTLDAKEADILGLHETMLSYSATEGGIYKNDDNVLIEVDASGYRRVRFEPTPAKETPETMNQLLLTYMEARNNTGINSLLLIPCFVLDFLCIHPFHDGNGRMSRLLSLLLLYKEGFDAGKYISFEGQINETKNDYYEALKDSSLEWHSMNNSYIPFIQYFGLTLLRCYKELDTRFSLVNGGKITKKSRIEATVLNSNLPVSKQEICFVLPDVSPTTVEATLAIMLKSGLIKKIGTGRSTKYLRA